MGQNPSAGKMVSFWIENNLAILYKLPMEIVSL
jgi:hypothetical protein